jgi:hypothetical protein
MKKIFIYISLVVTSVSFAQVGVNTTTPQEELHIEGATSTIRVEGLNFANNTLNLGTVENTRVYVDTDGDLVLGDGSTDIEVLFNPANYLEDPLDTGGANSNQINQTGVGSGYSEGGWPRQTGPGLSTFTLTRNAIVEINYSLSYEIYKSGIGIDDHHARTVQFYVYLRRNGPANVNPGDANLVRFDVDGNPINFAGNAGALGYSGQFYTNGNSNGASGLQGFDRKYFATGHDYVKLGPGTYTPMFAGVMFVANTLGTGAVKMQIGGGDDEIVVVAHYYN